MSINDMSSNTQQGNNFVNSGSRLGVTESQAHEVVETSLLEAGKLWGALVDKKWLIIFITVLSFLLGIFLSLKVKPVYIANALIEIDSAGMKDLDALGDTFSSGGSSTEISADIEVMNSRMVLGSVVEELKLQISTRPKMLPVVGVALASLFKDKQLEPIYSAVGLESYTVGGETIDVSVLEIPEAYPFSSLIVKSLEEGQYKVLSRTGKVLLESGAVGESLSIPVDDELSISMQVDAIDAHDGAEFFVGQAPLVQSLASLQSKFDVVERAKKSGILRLTYEANAAEKSANVLNAIVDSFLYQSVEKYSEQTKRSLTFIEEQLPLVKRKLEASERAYNDYRVNYGSVDLEAETRSILKKTETFDAEILELELRRSEIRLLYKESHPEIIALDKKIRSLQGRKASLEQRFGDMPDVQQDILSLEREVNVNTALYTKMQSVAQELRVAKAGATGHVRVIDYALPPSSPKTNNAKLMIILTTFIGLFGSITIVGMLRAFQGGKINDSDDIEGLGLPVLASISSSSVQSKISKVAKKKTSVKKVHALSIIDPDDPAIECLRSLRTITQTHSDTAANNIVAISGPSPYAGKSFVSLNLAVLLAKAGNKVLLVDADMRRGHLHVDLGLSHSPGFSNLLYGDREDVVKETGVEDLHFIATGSRSNRPADHLSHTSINATLKELAESYDYVVLDTPPILAVSDAAIVAQSAGLVMLVVREGDATKKMLLQSVRAFKRANVGVDGIVFNGVPKAKSNYVYDYSYD